MSESALSKPGLRYPEGPGRGAGNPGLRRTSDAGLVGGGMGRWLVALALLAGCDAAGSEMDARLVRAEQDRQAALDDPRTLTLAATSLPASRPTTRPVLSLTIQQAVLMTLARNRNLVVQRFTPQITAQGEAAQYGQFDPLVTAGLSGSRTWPGPGGLDISGLDAQAAVQEFFVTGTTATLGLTAQDAGTHLYGDRRDDEPNLRLGLSVTQQLLQGNSLRVNLASIRQAQLDVIASKYELRGFTETLAATVETAYINYLQDERVLHIAESGLKVAEDQLTRTEGLIAAGRSAASDRPAAAALVAQRHSDIINARSTLEQARLTFMQLVNDPTADVGGEWTTVLHLTQPAVPVTALDDVDNHVRVALRYRADLNQARVSAERNDLQVVRTADGLRPLLSVFVTGGRTWQFHAPVSGTGGVITTGNTTVVPGGTVLSAPGYRDGAGEDLQAGVNFSYPLLNRAATANYRAAIASRDEATQAVANLAQQVELDVRSAYQEVVRAREQITATTATLAARRATADVERERFGVGRSTNILVNVAEQDVLNSQIDQATAVAAYLNGLVNLYRVEGSLLERRGVMTADRGA